MKIIGMITAYNEDDIIQETIEHLLAQGLELVILDNGSNDETYNICKKFSDNGKINLFQFKTSTFDEDLINRAIYDKALTFSPDWIVYSDADEFLEPPQEYSSLKEFIEKTDAEGYNLIQFDRFDFFITDDDIESAKSIKDKIRYYSYLSDYVYRSWKFTPGIRLDVTKGHYPIFPEKTPYRISPHKGILRHYKFRSKEQALKKINDRSRGYNHFIKKNPLMGKIYKSAYQTDFTKPISHKKLTKYNEDNKWNFKIKNLPYSWVDPPKKEELFTTDGFLKNPIKTTLEYERLWEYEKRRIIPRNMRRAPSFIIRKLIKKFKHV